MDAQTIKCSQCNGELKDGFLADKTIFGTSPLEWIEGYPENTLFSGMKTSGGSRHTVYAYRCDDCGRIEFYTIKGKSEGVN